MVRAEAQGPRLAVYGAGHGGMALAGYLALKGCCVKLLNKSAARIAAVRERGGIELEGLARGFGPVSLATTDPRLGVAGVDVILVVVPATAHGDVARALAPHLVDGQVIILNPGRTGGALEVDHVLRQAGLAADVTVAEAQTFIFASRASGPGQARIFGKKQQVAVAALPGCRTEGVLRRLQGAVSPFVAAPDVLTTSLNNVGAIVHPGPTILNAARIESTEGDFEYYHEGITPAVGEVLEAMDAERVAVAAGFGIRATACLEWFASAYGVTAGSIYEATQKTEGYAGILAPNSVDHRYISEDVPTSLVPLSDLGRLAGVSTPTLDGIIHLGSLMHRTDYRALGRTLARLGLEGMTIPEIIAFVEGDIC